MNKFIILLSGGLDSAVSLAQVRNDNPGADILCLFFDYGQKSAEFEKLSSERLADYFGAKFQCIELDWLKKITNNALTAADSELPLLKNEELDDFEAARKSAKAVWVPNRNGLFVNIAGCYCDAFGYGAVVLGANKEEAVTFSDNSKDFITAMTKGLELSTLCKPKVVAPLIDLEKYQIIQKAKELKFPFELIRSCYSTNPLHCGKCESCLRLKRGLERENLFDIVNLLFN
ncbi:MAG: 7-cyano-7-deazaguanine synthase QueC [Candidatus Gastranaerophilales bacterium]|nr:7-cyano-7-deazaguanine synthase QueC [Candidatus Gastranaerophilales bacterium]